MVTRQYRKRYFERITRRRVRDERASKRIARCFTYFVRTQQREQRATAVDRRNDNERKWVIEFEI